MAFADFIQAALNLIKRGVAYDCFQYALYLLKNFMHIKEKLK